MRKLSYSHQTILQSDNQYVIEALNSDYITGGKYLTEFEDAVASYTGAKFAIAFNSGTAAIHAALFASGIKPEDEVIVPAITYVATSNAICYLGAKPVFVDIDLGCSDYYITGANLSFSDVERKLTSKTRAIIPVDYAGSPVDIKSLRSICPNAVIIEDAAHALGSTRYGKQVGTDADITTFSFHPVKAITTGEGGMAVTNNPEYYHWMKIFRQNGTTYYKPHNNEPWRYDQIALGYNYKLCDINAALGLSQLKHIDYFLYERRRIANFYDNNLPQSVQIFHNDQRFENNSSYHLYPILVKERLMMYDILKMNNINCQVHYYPVPLQPYYSERYGYTKGMFPNAEWFYNRELSIPIYPLLMRSDAQRVVDVIKDVLHE